MIEELSDLGIGAVAEKDERPTSNIERPGKRRLRHRMKKTNFSHFNHFPGLSGLGWMGYFNNLRFKLPTALQIMSAFSEHHDQISGTYEAFLPIFTI